MSRRGWWVQIAVLAVILMWGAGQGLCSELAKRVPLGQKAGRFDVAVLVANKNYRHPGVPEVKFALRDLEMVKAYVINTLGFDPRNILEYRDATKGALETLFGTAAAPQGKLHNWVRPGESRVFVYYVGHGAPAAETGEGHLVPVDADPDHLAQAGYPLKLFYANLEKIPAKELIVVLDTCFSGQTPRGFLLKNASPALLRVQVQSPRMRKGVIIASARADQISSWYEEERQSLFTYYFLKGLQGEADANKDTVITVKELGEYLSSEVPYWARRFTGREQQPQVIGQEELVLARLTGRTQTVALLTDTPPPEKPALVEEVSREARIADLLKKARTDLKLNRLTLPQGDNALERFQEVLKLDPENRAALEGLSEIVGRYVGLAEGRIRAGDLDKAQEYLDRAASISEGDSRVLAAMDRLNQARQPKPAAPAPAPAPAVAAPAPPRPSVPAPAPAVAAPAQPPRLAVVERPGKKFLQRSDFSSDQTYGDYIKSKLQSGMRVRALADYGKVKRGMFGTYYTGVYPNKGTPNPGCFVVWDNYLNSVSTWLDTAPASKKGHQYWVHWHQVEILDQVRAEPVRPVASVSTFRRRSDFSSDQAYGEYVKSNLRSGMRVRAVTDYGKVKRGMSGTFHDGPYKGTPPCFVLWDQISGSGSTWRPEAPADRKGHQYWVEWHHVEIVDQAWSVPSRPAVSVPTFRRRSDFSSDKDYGDYVKSRLRPGARVRARVDFEKIKQGMFGTYYGTNDGNPPCFVIWDRNLGSGSVWLDSAPAVKKGHQYWVQWHQVEIVGP